MATLTNGQNETLSLDAFDSVSLVCDRSCDGSLAFTSGAPNLKSNLTAKLQNKTYGPYGVPGTVVITVTAGSATSTMNRVTPKIPRLVAEKTAVTDGAIQTADQVIGSLSIPAGSLNVGDCFRVLITYGRDVFTDAYGTATTLRMGTAGTTSDTSTASANLSSLMPAGSILSAGLEKWYRVVSIGTNSVVEVLGVGKCRLIVEWRFDQRRSRRNTSYPDRLQPDHASGVLYHHNHDGRGDRDQAPHRLHAFGDTGMINVPTIHDVPRNALYAAKQGNGTFLCYLEADRASLPASVFPPDPGPSKDDIDAEAARSYAKLKALVGMTPAQVQTWVAANVTNLAQAQDAIATLAVAVSVLARRL